MKKQILITLLTVFTAITAFADKENSRLQAVALENCGQQEMAKAISATANWVMYDSDGRSNLETALMTTAEKKAGASAKVFKVVAPKNISLYNRKISRAESAAKVSGVAVAEPVPFQVVYSKKNVDASIERGRVILSVACRVEKVMKDGKESLKHTGQLIEFEVKPKGVK